MTPLVSILIPAFNAEKWIGDTIKSAIGQTWPRKEIIVVDDGSSDRTAEVARQFSSTDVLVETQQNQGAAAARNRALSLSQGDYIQWLDADDLLSPDKVAQQIETATHSGSRRTLFSSNGDISRIAPIVHDLVPHRSGCDLDTVNERVDC
jgi:glycosyltransferase involved in cell wall biosynthesis